MSTVPHNKITIRQPSPLKAKVEQAAALRGMTVTSFINGVLELAADETLERVRARELSARDSEALLAMLREPEGANEALRAAAERHRGLRGG